MYYNRENQCRVRCVQCTAGGQARRSANSAGGQRQGREGIYIMKMKRLVSMILAVMLFVAVIPATAFASSSKTVYVSRNGGKIYMRTGPGYDYEAGSTVKHNAKVTVKDTSGKWSKIKVNSTGKTGWIRTMYINGTTKDLGTGYKAIKEATTVYS